MTNTRSRRRNGQPRYSSEQVRAALPAPSPPTVELVPLSTRVTPDLKRRLKVAAAVNEVSIQDAIAQAVLEWVEAHSTT